MIYKHLMYIKIRRIEEIERKGKIKTSREIDKG